MAEHLFMCVCGDMTSLSFTTYTVVYILAGFYCGLLSISVQSHSTTEKIITRHSYMQLQHIIPFTSVTLCCVQLQTCLFSYLLHAASCYKLQPANIIFVLALPDSRNGQTGGVRVELKRISSWKSLI